MAWGAGSGKLDTAGTCQLAPIRSIVGMYRSDTSALRFREEGSVAKRSGVLEFAVLGLLHESPMHGYELRKRLNLLLGTLRAISYGSLYPCLKSLLAAGRIIEESRGVA